MKRLKDIVELAVEQTVQRFEKSSLHTESIMMGLRDNPEIKKYLNVELEKIETLIQPKKVTEQDENLVGQKVKLKKQNNSKINHKITHRDLLNLSAQEKEKVITQLYTYRDLNTLTSLEFSVLEVVSTVHNLGMRTILSKYRGIDVVVARTQFLVIMCDLFNYTTIAAGVLVIRDHSTVVHARRAHKDYIDFLQDRNYVESFNKVLSLLEHRYPEFFHLDEAKINNIQNIYKKAANRNKKLANRTINGVKIIDILADNIKIKNAETN